MTHVLIVAAPYYRKICERLVAGAVGEIKSAHATYEIVEVPGALEIPAAIKFAETTGKYEGYIALGCVIRGETSHYNYVCSQSAHGLQMLMMTQGLAIGNGILTTENYDQAWVRADPAQKNKGRDAAAAALALARLKHKFS